MRAFYLFGIILGYFIVISSCTEKRAIIYPEGLQLIGKEDTMIKNYKDYSKFNKSFVAYIGSQNPKTELYRIELALQDAVDKGMGYVIYVSGTPANEVKKTLKDLDYNFAVYVDINSQFQSANDIESTLRYTGFIVNSKGEYLSSPLIHYRE